MIMISSASPDFGLPIFGDFEVAKWADRWATPIETRAEMKPASSCGTMGNLLNSADVFHGNPGKPYSFNRKILFEGVRVVLFSCFYLGDSSFVGHSCGLYPHDSQC